MAKILAAVLFFAAFVAGCQQKTVESLPLPNLNGPVVTAPPAPAQPPITSKTPDKSPARFPVSWAPRTL